MKTKIDWADYSLNPIKGRCPNETCPLGERCYARGFYRRFKWDPTLRFEPKVFEILYDFKEPARIFMGSTIELFDEHIPAAWLWEIKDQAEKFPQHTFIFLTKKPENLHKWHFSDNCWVGISATSKLEYITALEHHQKSGHGPFHLAGAAVIMGRYFAKS